MSARPPAGLKAFIRLFSQHPQDRPGEDFGDLSTALGGGHFGGLEVHAPAALSTKGAEPKRSHVSGYGAGTT